MTPIDAVVFDLDGLLIDSEPLQAWAWGTYVERFGAVMTQDILHQMLGMRAVDATKIAVELLKLPVSLEVALRDRDEVFLAEVPGRINAMPGALVLIQELKQRGIPIGLATSGHRRYVDSALESAGLLGSFDIEVTGDQVARGKPFPDIYIRAAELLDVEPARCLALEDVPNGIRSAKAAGMLCFAIPGDPELSLDYSDADAVLPSLSDVIAELERRGLLR